MMGQMADYHKYIFDIANRRFVGSADELEDEVSQYFEILERVDLKVSRFVILFCRNRNIEV